MTVSKKKPGRNDRIGITVAVVVLLTVAFFFGKRYFQSGDGGPAAQAPMRQTPVVVLHTVQQADLSVGREYVGRVEPIQQVELKPQVSGEVEKVHFREGSAVKEGDILFSLDDTQYRATVALRRAELAKAEANSQRAVKYHERLKAADSRSVSASDLDMSESDVLQSKAAVEQARAALRLASIDLSHTRIKAPISGQVGKAMFTRGNYVTPASGNLTTIVQKNPIRITFSLPDREYLDQMESFKSTGEPVYDATIRLSNGDEYPLKGSRDFESNTMDQKTGTMMISLRFENGSGLLIPGAMVRVLVKPAESRIALIVPQEALLVDPQGDFVYVVDSSDVASRRVLELGEEYGTMREVVSGLEPGEKVILQGIQSVRPGATVKPISLEDGSNSRTPAEIAMESDFDLNAVVSPDITGDEQ